MQAFVNHLTEMAQQYRGKSTELMRAQTAGDLVALRTHQTQPGGDEYVTMDYYRFDADGNIVEHQDAIPAEPDHGSRKQPVVSGRRWPM